ncbi:TetR/AcrR family transcriptional regulator [Microbacterium sulfonylureivorans]|uniref:TetR/AcrR family transcriptional regulator n=1 Tax=Microbacterium sulfonylureivorans TaxID=2486854 RepID=UPI000FDB62E5|nr:TetR family transcriptional regulator [Microbacterium sulfonylureivorans]
MRSVPTDDLTMRARIRDAAIELFGVRGFDRTTIRQIAEAVGASPALIVHHFGSKDGLRSVCDDYVVTTLLADRGAVVDGPDADAVASLLAATGEYRSRLDYLARLVTEPSEAGARVFDAFLAHTRQMLRDAAAGGPLQPMSDPDVTALLLTAYGLAPLLLQAHLGRILGVDPLSPEGAEILAVPGLELFTRGIYRDESLLRATEEALTRGMGPRSDKGEGDPNQDPDPPVADAPLDPDL